MSTYTEFLQESGWQNMRILHCVLKKGTKPPKMYLYSTQKSHQTWRFQMKSWSALQELILIMCKFSNTEGSEFFIIFLVFILQSYSSVIITAKKAKKKTNRDPHFITQSQNWFWPPFCLKKGINFSPADSSSQWRCSITWTQS